MTREVNRPADDGPGHNVFEVDIIAALWEQVPFPRLPADAPSEIKELVINVENPKRVYAIYRASRRHDLQLLVEKFIAQLRYGCGFSACTTPSCFSCRKRLAGKAPIRRYNPTSARTLAIFMASQDDADSRLCPHLHPPTGPSDAIKPLIFGLKRAASSNDASGPAYTGLGPKLKSTKGAPGRVALKRGQSPIASSSPSAQMNWKETSQYLNRPPEVEATKTEPSSQLNGMDGIHITEKSISKDYRSFAANVFGSVAFKMLEWLTPNNIENALETTGKTDPTSELDCYLPQSLSRFNVQAINFICDVLQEDTTSERHLLEPPTIDESTRRSSNRLKPWKRKRKSQASYPQDLKLQWKLFVEQSIFHVLSDPQAVLDSFTSANGTIDSQTLWYCMLRLTRVAPNLVFDSLWTALAALFAPPKTLQSMRSPTSKMFLGVKKSFTNVEAASLMSVCFHALVAAAPLVNDSRQLNDMSRIRAHGLSLAGGGTVARQPSSLCLQYEDAFTDSMALRLARRLLRVIPTRRYFDELIELDLDKEDGVKEPDVVELLLLHLESSTQSTLHFSKAERSMHEKRVPVLLLDWARAVMLHEWEGKPDISGDGPFGGALSLMTAMYQKRQSLLLGDVHFRAEYFGDRLDPIQMPVSWLSFTSTRQKVHILDYPYIFNPTSLVSYFRAINFSRMSRSYEESTSLQNRINAIIAPDSLVTESHQKNVLQDLLKIPSSKYLILDISRKNVLRDAFDQLWRRQERELMRPLKVHLGEDSGEEGFDSGGVQQEFFRLAIAEALDPTYGAFVIDDRTRMTWFQPGSAQPEWKFELIGLLMSLAVYNGLTLPITFPKALYRKLLGEPVTELHHIADGWPDLANGLTNILEWNEKDGSIEDVFVLTYEFSTSMFGQPVSREMESSNSISWPQFSSHPESTPLSASNPSDAPLVTGDNRNAYVSDYIRYLTDVSVAPQFNAFARGFRACLHPKSLQLLTPSLLQNLAEGTQEIDVGELRRAARYVGWDASHRTVRDFWSIIKRYDSRMRRKLLEFVTASDRVPVGGMANIQFVVQKNGEEEGEGGHLPTAYTCYGTLLLPEYRDKEVLRERLSMALENAQGFGFA
ncbi:Ubiquitin-protein ligase E3A [Daldinia childiae]|uniref:Ubiquitin-protein ligase E3A n=1 Tax=Daldinia childiae TaxID=326645 RepID=UPI00144814A9|nr:Ubiquitin-protein ligase E3A [Daldinia childiae]KAF3068371.1 Ubiquitin-protein ligase E3A [Daldinia childiae]